MHHNEGMHPVRLACTVDVSTAFLSHILQEAAIIGAAYWATVDNQRGMRDSQSGSVLTVQADFHDRDALMADNAIEAEHGGTVTLPMVRHAIEQLLGGQIAVDSTMQQALLQAVVLGDTGKLDAAVSDVIVQVALFGAIRFR